VGRAVRTKASVAFQNASPIGDGQNGVAMPRPKISTLRLAVLWCITAGAAVAVAADKDPAPAAPETEWDASEIAARAVASAAAAAREGEENSDLAREAYDAVVRDLLSRIEATEKENGHVTRELEAPLYELGKLYVSAGQCQNAISILRRAILLTQRLDGVMNTRQLRMHEPMLRCLVERDYVRDLGRALDQMVLVSEAAYGKNDARLLAALGHVGEWYEEAGQYESARDTYNQATRIARTIGGGEQNILLVKPLRALARTYQLEMQYEQEALRGRALDAQGQRLLERAARIVRAQTDADSNLRIDTLLELADWYQMSGAVRDAVKAYKEVWAAAVAAGRSGSGILGKPVPVLYRAAVGVALRRPPEEQAKLKHYWIDFEFRVTRFGQVEDVMATASTAPRDLQLGIAENLKRTHYRPRFVDGEAVDTEGVKVRQGVWVSP
jgi:tetratricopeptide (TPR) repeat protein